jgi:hypothetical protein
VESRNENKSIQFNIKNLTYLLFFAGIEKDKRYFEVHKIPVKKDYAGI